MCGMLAMPSVLNLTGKSDEIEMGKLNPIKGGRDSQMTTNYQYTLDHDGLDHLKGKGRTQSQSHSPRRGNERRNYSCSSRRRDTYIRQDRREEAERPYEQNERQDLREDIENKQ